MKKRKPQGATLRNVRATKKREADILRMILNLEKRIEKLERKYEERYFATR